MKAALLKAIGKLGVEDIPRPEVNKGAILLKVEACAICSTDVKIYRHGYSGFKPPLILGHEISGTITALGQGVSKWHEGDRVAIGPNIACGQCWFCKRGFPTACDNLRIIGIHMDGGFAEFTLIPGEAVRGDCLNIIPPKVSPEEASLIDPVSCAINAGELSAYTLPLPDIKYGKAQLSFLFAKFLPFVLISYR